MIPGKIAALAAMLIFGLWVWWITSPPKLHPGLTAGSQNADAAMDVCRYVIQEGLDNPDGLVWAESGALRQHSDGIWNVSVMYRAPGISPRVSFCKLQIKGSGA